MSQRCASLVCLNYTTRGSVPLVSSYDAQSRAICSYFRSVGVARSGAAFCDSLTLVAMRSVCSGSDRARQSPR